MKAHSDDELLHAWLDGALSDEDAARVRERIAADTAFRARAEELERLGRLVASLGPAEPPTSFTDRVMGEVARSDAAPAAWWRPVQDGINQLLGRVPRHLQQEAPSGAVVRWNTGSAGGGDIVAKKALWAVAGVAVVIILAVVYFNGTRTVDQGAQGTIGGAERYRGAQPASVTVTESDMQKFLQSDTFDRIIKDPHVLKLFTNLDARRGLASDSFEGLLRDHDASLALKTDAVEVLLHSQDARLALGDEDVVAVFAKPSLVTALADDEVASELRMKKKLVQELADEDVALAFGRAKVREAMLKYVEAAGVKDQARIKEANAELEAALKLNPKAKRVIGDAELFASLTKNLNSALLFTDSTFLSAMRSGQGRSLFTTVELSNALKKDAAKLFVNLNFQAMLKKYPKLFDDAELFTALDNAEFVGLMETNAALKASLNNSEALDAALQRLQERRRR